MGTQLSMAMLERDFQHAMVVCLLNCLQAQQLLQLHRDFQMPGQGNFHLGCRRHAIEVFIQMRMGLLKAQRSTGMIFSPTHCKVGHKQVGHRCHQHYASHIHLRREQHVGRLHAAEANHQVSQ